MSSNNNVAREDYKEGKRVFLEEKYGGGKPVLLKGCKSGAIGFSDVETLVEICQVDIFEKDEKGNSAMYYAGYNNMEDVGSYLWSKGEDNNIFKLGKRVMLEDKYGGTPALLKGCKSGRMTVEDAKTLVEICQVNISETDENGNSAMYYSGYNNIEDVGTYLSSKGEDNNIFAIGKMER